MRLQRAAPATDSRRCSTPCSTSHATKLLDALDRWKRTRICKVWTWCFDIGAPGRGSGPIFGLAKLDDLPPAVGEGELQTGLQARHNAGSLPIIASKSPRK